MEFDNEFTIPVPPARAWDALMDMDRVAQCMPGATLLESDGERFVGRVKVKVGPITVSYKGSAEFLERDPDSMRAVLAAKGREERGAGNASMSVTTSLLPLDDGATKVQLHTDLDITGKPAQFGRGVMGEVGTAIIEQFAKRLATQLVSEAETTEEVDPQNPTTGSQTADGAAPDGGAGPRTGGQTTPRDSVNQPDDALNLGSVAWAPMAKRAIPVVAVGAGILVGLLFRRRSHPAVVLVCPAADRHARLVT